MTQLIQPRLPLLHIIALLDRSGAKRGTRQTGGRSWRGLSCVIVPDRVALAVAPLARWGSCPRARFARHGSAGRHPRVVAVTAASATRLWGRLLTLRPRRRNS
jgi:hypothetical protein